MKRGGCDGFRWWGVLAWVALGIVPVHAMPAYGASFVEFESGEVRPLAMSPDGTRLFAVNTPDNRLEIFTINAGTPALTHTASVSVGLEPVAVATRSNNEVWVVNHLSDSVSIVDVSANPPRVSRTLLVGDEPRDIVFAGTAGVDRAFITCAHRGQNSSVPRADQTRAGIGRADVWVFDAADQGAALGGTPVSSTPVVLFGDTPRALAVSPDRSTVYAAVFDSGNRTTTVSEGSVPDGGFNSGGLPFPNTDASGDPQPEVGLVVKFDGTHWTDRACVAGANAGWACQHDDDCPSSTCGRTWDSAVKFSLPDKDVFAINANGNPPAETTSWGGVGTILFNMVTNPVSGKVYVTNGESNNVTRFEGPGIFGRSTVQGHLLEMRITVLDGATVLPRHLNKHIPYATRPAPAGVKDKSLATPLGMAITSDGTQLYVAAFGSSTIGVFNTAELENDSFVPSSASHIPVSGGGPSAVLLDEGHGRLYVHTRFDNGIAVVDTTSRTEIDHPSMYNPEPATVVNGRPILYDAAFTSSNGEASCSSCHIFGDFDSLAWDLGNPDDSLTPNPLVVKLGLVAATVEDPTHFHPLKGPMTTQTLRGMVNHGAMHWRGDRVQPTGNQQCQTAGFPFACCTGAASGSCTVYDPEVAFQNFRVAFPGLVGRDSQIPDADMKAFSDFILQVYQPPNPNRNLDNSRTAAQSGGFNFFQGNAFQSSVTGTSNNGRCSDGASNLVCSTSSTGDDQLAFACHGCHTLNPSKGFFGGDGKQSFEAEPQLIKVAHLRNLYQKVGMFGMPSVGFFNNHGAVCLGGANNGLTCASNADCPGAGAVCGENILMGDQVRGFGFLHDGSVATIYQFLHAGVFQAHSGIGFPNNDSRGGDSYRRDLEQMLLAFDSDFAPIVGQQVTLTSSNAGVVGPRIDLLIQRAATAFTLKDSPGAHECDLVVKGTIGGFARGWVQLSDGTFQADRNAESPITDTTLRGLAATPGQDLTYTCVPPGSGTRIGIDRDLDGYYDRTELDAGSDPANPASTPGPPTATPTLDATATPTATPTRTVTSTPSATRTPSVTSTPTATRTPSATATPTPTQTPSNTPTVTATEPPSATPTDQPTATPTLATLTCAGDCDGSAEVTVNELVTLVGIVLGTAETSACPNGIPAGRPADITLIIQAVGYALTQCPA